MQSLEENMLTVDKLKEIRTRAQEAVADMPESDLKTRAFEVILQHLLTSESAPRLAETTTIPHPSTTKTKTAISKKPGSTKSRVLLLKDEGFFAVPRSLSEINSELRAHGWVLPRTSLSGPLQSLVQDRELRRIKEQGPKQKIWKYVNP
jgi:hypothetical protein